MNGNGPPTWIKMSPDTDMVDGEKYLLAFKRMHKPHNTKYWYIERIEVLIDDHGTQFLLDDGDEFTDFLNEEVEYYIHLQANV